MVTPCRCDEYIIKHTVLEFEGLNVAKRSHNVSDAQAQVESVNIRTRMLANILP